MDNEIGTAWFTEMFIPFANNHKVTNMPVVLLLNGHNLHESDMFCEAAFQHQIIVVTFPSKCTHKLQPLDVIIFTQVQCLWLNHCDKHIVQHIKMDHYNIIQEYMEIHPWSMTPKLLRSAFSTTGTFPFNDALFTDNDFASAKSFSYTMHVPMSFPVEVPSSPPFVLSDFSDLETSGNNSNSAESMAVDAPAEHHSWDTDSSDFNYKLALDCPFHLPVPTAAATPPDIPPC
jgi:hypothetical protein